MNTPIGSTETVTGARLRLLSAALQSAGRGDAFLYAWRTCKGDLTRLQAYLDEARTSPPQPHANLLASDPFGLAVEYQLSYLSGLGEAVELIKQHVRLNPQIAEPVPPALLLLMWLHDGRKDAYRFAADQRDDVSQVRKEIQETEEMLARPTGGAQADPMAPGNSPRSYREGYLAGLKDALAIVTGAASPAQPEVAAQTRPSRTPRKRQKAVAEKPKRYAASRRTTSRTRKRKS